MARYRIAGLFLAVALVFLSPRSAPAGFEEGHAAYERGDYHTAFREMMPLALAGDPAAQFNLGVMYAQGRGVPRDDAEAVRWYRLAADQGFAEAQYILGAMYVAGRGVPQDDAGAVRWYRSAADQGVAEAQGALGAMYAFGQGVPRDDAEAVRWYRLAADQGSALGQLSLGAMYAEGRGVSQDDVLAYVWFSLAAAQGGEIRESAVAARDQVAARLPPAQRARGQELARIWRPGIAAQRRVIEVQQNLTDLGYDPGPVDGVVGPRTRAATRNFQADIGMPVDGEISDKLYTALNDAASSSRSVAARSTLPQRRLASTGTGFAVSEDGYLVTNDHVVAGCAEVRVRGAWSDLSPL